MIDLDDTYRRLARPWTHTELAAHYRAAEDRGAGFSGTPQDDLTRPIGLLATAIPPAATLNVAIHVLHVLPHGTKDDIAQDLLASAATNAANALHRCHRALALDGERHDYEAEAWLATVWDVAVPPLRSARRDQDPPTVVQQAQEAISWLSRAILELDRDSAETATALAEALSRLLVLCVFANDALAARHGDR